MRLLVFNISNEDAEFLFIQNYNSVPADFSPDLQGAEVLFGEVTGEMKPFSTIILKRQKV